MVKVDGDGVANAKAYFTPEVRIKALAQLTINLMMAARVDIILLWGVMTHRVSREVGAGARSVRECSIARVQRRVFAQQIISPTMAAAVPAMPQ